MENLKPKILVTGCGAPGAFGILSSLAQDFELYGCDMQEETIGSSLVNQHFTVPSGDDPQYINTMLKQCIALDIQLVFPITTKELTPLSKAKKRFEEEGIAVLVSSEDQLAIANNKGNLYQHLAEAGVSVPDYRIVKEMEDFMDAAESWTQRDKPFVFKPCIANGSRGFRIIDNSNDWSQLLFSEKPINTYMSLEQAIDTLSSQTFPPLLVSDYLPGKEYTIDCLVDKGTPLLIVPRTRDKLNNGISVAGEIIQDAKVIDYCKEILQTLKLHGPIGIQVKLNEENEPRLLEINPRIQGTSVALNGAGIPFIGLCVGLGLGMDISEELEALDIQWGTRFKRHYQEIYWKP